MKKIMIIVKNNFRKLCKNGESSGIAGVSTIPVSFGLVWKVDADFRWGKSSID